MNLSYQGQSTMHDLAQLLPWFFVILIGILVILFIVMKVIKKSDDGKPAQRCQAEVIEKPASGSQSVQWYVFQLDTGNRIKLRTFQGNSLLLRVGDKGALVYKGQTIQSFTPNGR